MSIFKIDAKTTALHVAGYIMGAAFLVTILVLMIPIIIFGLTVDLIEKVSGYHPYLIHHYFDRLFYYLNDYTDRYLTWVTKITTTEKEKMWGELTKAIKESDEEEN